MPAAGGLRPTETELARGGSHGGAYGRKRVVAVGLGAAGDGEKFFLEFAGDGAGDAFADLNVVDGTDGGDFDGGAGEEDFVDDVKHFAGDDAFLDGDLQVFADFDDRFASDAGPNASGQRRGRTPPLLHQSH